MRAVAGAALANERGLGLMEVILSTVIAMIAVLGLAYTLGTGRGLVNRFEVARLALASAQDRMEMLAVLPATAPELDPGPHPAAPEPFLVDGVVVGGRTWQVDWYDDPLTTSSQHDLRKVTVVVRWGGRSTRDSVSVVRLFP